MGVLTGGIVAAALGASSLFYLRRRVSRNWINLRSKEFDLSDKLVVVTGGNVGLGFESAQDFARRNARVVLGCRDINKGEEAVKSIKEKTGNDAVECLEVDLGSLASVRKFCTELKSKYPPIYALVLNAGVWYPMDEKKKTSDGFEIHFGVNHLGHFEMARLLIDQMAEAGSRIVIVSSSLAKTGKIDFETQDFVREGRVAEEDGKKSFAPTGYCDSKLMNALTCRYLTTILPPHVTTYAVCPGFCRSSLGRHVSFPLYQKMLVAPIMLMIQRTSIQGAQNIVFATVEDTSNLQNGCFYRDGEIQTEVTDHADSLGADAPERLWKLSEKLADEV